MVHERIRNQIHVSRLRRIDAALQAEKAVDMPILSRAVSDPRPLRTAAFLGGPWSCHTSVLYVWLAQLDPFGGDDRDVLAGFACAHILIV